MRIELEQGKSSFFSTDYLHHTNGLVYGYTKCIQFPTIELDRQYYAALKASDSLKAGRKLHNLVEYGFHRDLLEDSFYRLTVPV